MISRKHSLSQSKAISYCLRKGRFVKSNIFRIKYVKSYDAVFRLAIIISKKNIKLAVDRNFLKRRVKHIIHKYKIDKIPIHLIVNVKQKIKNIEFQQLEKELSNLLNLS